LGQVTYQDQFLYGQESDHIIMGSMANLNMFETSGKPGKKLIAYFTETYMFTAMRGTWQTKMNF